MNDTERGQHRVEGTDLGKASQIGELDFGGVTFAAMGSLLEVTGVVLLPEGGGGPLRILPFDVQDVPEPGALALTGLGLLGAGHARRRRR